MDFYRTLKKIKSHILSLLLAIAVSITALPYITEPLQVQADNAGGGDAGGGTAQNVGGASDSKCGYRMYVVDKNGNLLSRVVDLVSQAPTTNKAGLSTRVGGGNTSELLLMPSDMPKPFKHNGICFMGNGMKTKAWMRSKGSDGVQNIVALIQKYLGADVANQFEDLSEEKFCVLEPIAWHNIYTGNQSSTNTGFGYYGTFYNWMQTYAQMGLPNGGFTKQLDNRILGRCLTLERDQPNLGLSRPSNGGLLDLGSVGNEGFGIQLYSNAETDEQTTCDEHLQPACHPAPSESKGKTTIVKNYRTKLPDSTYIDDGCYKTQNVSNKITIEEEEEYRVVGWKTSDSTVYPIDPINWNPPGNITQQGKTAGNTKLIYPKEKTLYVLLEKSEEPEEEEYDADYIVKESQISRKISLNTTDKGDDILLGKEFIWKFGDLKTCGGHYQKGSHDNDCEEGCTEDHGTTNYCKFDLVDKNWLFDIINEKEGDYPNNLAVALWPSEYNESIPGERETVEEGEIAKDGFTYDVVIHRGNDNLGIADFVSENNKSLGELADFTVTNQKGHTRKEVDFQDSIELSFGDNSTDKITTSKGTLGCQDEDEDELSENYDVNVDILYKTYSGDQGEGKVNTDINSDDMIFSSGSKIISGHMVKSGLNFNYLPLVTMRYDDMETKDNLIEVLGEYYRGMDLNDYAEVIWEKQKHPNLSLSSLQWSTHAQPKADLDGLASDDDEGKCLPGGASFSIGIRKENREKIVARTYQCILIDEGREQVELTSGNSIDGFTEETALENHDAYVKSIEDGVNGMWIQQFQAKNMNENPLKQGIQVFNGYDISKLGVTKTASVEDKYYFSNSFDQTANSGCLDFKEGNTNTELYTFSSDRCGNILMNGSVILNKTQDASALSGKAKEINDRTLVVTKLVDSLERNTGDDAENTWTDSKWYNEQFRGITVAVSTTTIETGFIKPVERTSVLDPKLNTKSSGQADLFKTGYMSAALKTSNYSESYGEDEVIGVFKDQMIKMDQMEWFYYSKKFYVSNITTQDLH